MKTLLIFFGLVLAAAVSIPLWYRTETLPGKGAHLAQRLPPAPSGWASREMPLGETEAVQGAVEKTLKFEDVYFREYRSGMGTLTVYIAYWGPGKMPTQLVASHTPDRCWSSAGWSCEEMKHGVQLAGLRGGEWRLFRAPNGSPTHVQYWHLVGTEIYDYGERLNQVPSIWRWWRDAAFQAFRAPAEQYFVRLASDRPFDQLAADPGWQELMAALGKLGLAAEPASPAR